jgi:glycosyltransferase involved in cell wall biosynthesis
MNMGGPAYHVSLLSGLLDPASYQTLLVSGNVGRGEASMDWVADSYGTKIRMLPSLRPELHPMHDVLALRELVRIARAFRPDVVHTHTSKAGFLGRLAAVALRPRPVIIHTYHGHVLEGYFGPGRSALYRGLENLMGRVSNRLIGVSAATVNDLVRLGVAPREKFEVIPLGLDLEPFLSLTPPAGDGFREELGARPSDVLLVYVGRIAPIKRLDLMLRALSEAREHSSQLRLALVGDGESRTALEAVAKQLGIDDIAHFLGYRRDLPEIAAAADVGVLSSDNEGTPVSLIQMAAAARPLISTRVGGVPDVVTATSGITVPPGDHLPLSKAFVTLGRDPALRRQMGRSAREHVRERFSSIRLLADVDALYRRLVCLAPPGPPLGNSTSNAKSSLSVAPAHDGPTLD